jgi:hypothetical protein
MAHPALNGVRPSEPAQEQESTGERVWATLPKELVKAIDDYHYENRFRNRSAAIRQLIEHGLKVVPFRGKSLT